MTSRILTRRQMLLRGSSVLGGLLLAGCDRLTNAPSFRRMLESAEGLTYRSQRLLLGSGALAREFREADLSPVFRSNGTSFPDSDLYRRLLENQFADWRLGVGGLVGKPFSLSLAALRAMPSRTQITRHDCVEGWSAIGKWTGVPLSSVLKPAQVKPHARYVVFHCADSLGASEADTYYESVDLLDAFHPQTLLAYELNGKPLQVQNGAPLRLRVERQLGYKHAKYIMGIDVVEGLGGIRGGKGGFWEDRGYEWYAGI
ncbi:MAG TPA: molybdopterin-dependent oxidoreductase [Steroidobacteraceae bacterium]|jgi:DMSO/TMAO reductase YedYZ molybdopterin-dependent catalytic subunit|nr:molybdopterin-dependent oxidoreductase [Steroidobacteraceae bacterium]